MHGTKGKGPVWGVFPLHHVELGGSDALHVPAGMVLHRWISLSPPLLSNWTVDVAILSGRVFYQSPAVWFSDTTLQEQWRTLDFPSRPLKKKLQENEENAFAAKKVALQRTAADREEHTPVTFALENSWSATLRKDKRYYITNRSLSLT
jgi:hypothetical protein